MSFVNEKIGHVPTVVFLPYAKNQKNHTSHMEPYDNNVTRVMLHFYNMYLWCNNAFERMVFLLELV